MLQQLAGRYDPSLIDYLQPNITWHSNTQKVQVIMNLL